MSSDATAQPAPPGTPGIAVPLLGFSLAPEAGRLPDIALEEALDVIELLWGDQRSVRYAGRHYHLSGAHPGPRPTHDVGIWIGALGPRMLRLVGRRATGWLPSSSYLPPEKLPDALATIDDAAHAAGRDPGAVRRIYTVNGVVAPDGSPTRGWFDGPADAWVDQLVRLTSEMGMTAYVFWPASDPVEQVTKFAEEVAPAVRAAFGRVEATGVDTTTAPMADAANTTAGWRSVDRAGLGPAAAGCPR